MASVSDLGVNSHFLGGHMAFTTDENRGGIGLLIKRAKEQGGVDAWESLSSGAPFSVTNLWKNKRERVTVSETFRRNTPALQDIPIQIPIQGVVKATGKVGFVCPGLAGRSYVVTGITEVHSLTEDTATEANLQVVIVRSTQAASAGQELLTAAEIDVETSGVAINTVSYASLDNTSDSQRTLRPGDALVVLFQNDAGSSDIATVEYKGVVTVTLSPRVYDTEQDFQIRRAITGDEVLATTGLDIFTAEVSRFQVVGVREVHAVAEAAAATLNFKLERCQGTEAAAAGDDLLAATAINMKGTANTVITPAIVTTGARDILEVGDRLKIHAALDNETANATTEYDGMIEVILRPVAPPAVEEVYVNSSFADAESHDANGQNIFIADDTYVATHVSERHTVVDSGGVAELNIHKLTGTTVPIDGVAIVTDGALDPTASANTTTNAALTATVANHVLVAGDRIGAAGDTALVDLDGCVTIRLEKVVGFGSLNLGKSFTAKDKTYELASLEAEWTRAERSAATLNLRAERLQGTEASGAGDLLHGVTDINVKGTADTITAATVLSSGVEDFAAGNRLGLTLVSDAGVQQNAAELDGLQFTAKFRGVDDGIEPAKEGVIFTAVGRSYKLVNVEVTWETAEARATTCNLIVERLQGTEKPGAASGGAGNRLVGLTDINVKGTVSTNTVGTVVTASNVDLIADGDRIAINFVDDAGTGTIVPTELDGLQVTLYLVPVTLEAFATS